MGPLGTTVISFVALAVAVSSIATASAEEAPNDTYQIIRATPNRVWRLNTRTGEVAVCTLDGAQLVCIPSVETPKLPARTYEQIEADRAKAEAAAEQKRQEEKVKSLKVLDQMIEAFRQFIRAAIKADAARVHQASPVKVPTGLPSAIPLRGVLPPHRVTD